MRVSSYNENLTTMAYFKSFTDGAVGNNNLRILNWKRRWVIIFVSNGLANCLKKGALPEIKIAFAQL